MSTTTTQRPTPITDKMEESLARATNVTRYYKALAQMRVMEVERDEVREQLEAMRQAIKEAYEALMLAPYRDQEALAKLQPFLKP